MKRTLTIAALAACLVAGSLALADIPDFVDFHAKWANDGTPPSWEVVKNDRGYDAPHWDASNILYVDNELNTGASKYAWLEIHFIGDEANPRTENNLGFYIAPDAQPESQTPQLLTVDRRDYTDNQAYYEVFTWKYLFVPQPEHETFSFFQPNPNGPDFGIPVQYFSDGKGDTITLLEVGTWCTPVPGSLLLCGIGLGFIGVVRRFRK